MGFLRRMNLLLLFSDGAGAYSDSLSLWTGRIILLLSPYCLDDFSVFIVSRLVSSAIRVVYALNASPIGDKSIILTPVLDPYTYFFGGTIASLQALATRIFTTVLAGILICSPVAGFLSTPRGNLEACGQC